jgi:hypothetical protein
MLSGTSNATQPANTIQMRVTAWTSRTDAFGRMNGTFTYEEEDLSPNSHNAVRYESELEDVYLLPDWLQLGASSGRRLEGQAIPRILPARFRAP